MSAQCWGCIILMLNIASIKQWSQTRQNLFQGLVSFLRSPQICSFSVGTQLPGLNVLKSVGLTLPAPKTGRRGLGLATRRDPSLGFFSSPVVIVVWTLLCRAGWRTHSWTYRVLGKQSHRCGRPTIFCPYKTFLTEPSLVPPTVPVDFGRREFSAEEWT